MAAKNPSEDPGLAPELNNGTDYRGNVAYDFDLGVPDKAFTCASCHSGGILEFDRETGVRHDIEIEKSWNNATDGTGFFSNATYSDSEIDGDLFSYTPDEYSRGYVGKPHKFNWKKSGVLDTDCFLCHADRSQDLSVNATRWVVNSQFQLEQTSWYADNPTPANPRVFVFEGLDENNNTVVISLGFPPKIGEVVDGKKVVKIDSANFYSDPLERLVSLYYNDVIMDCMNNSGFDIQTLAVSDPATFMKIRSFTISVITGYLRLGQTTDIPIPYSKLGGTDYTYNGTGLLNFFNTFYLDPGAPNFSARDYLRNAFYESTTEGQPYVDSGMFLRVTTMNDNFTYDPTNSTVPFVRLARAGFFFGWADSGTLMGVSLGGAIGSDNETETLSHYPLAFVKLEKQPDGTFRAVTYYAKEIKVDSANATVDLSAVRLPILETSGHYTLYKADENADDGVSKVHTGDNDDSLTYMCAQCHFAMPDENNKWYDPQGNAHPSWYVRRGIIGMGADVVKRAAVFSRESENDTSIAPIAMNTNGIIAKPEEHPTEGLPIGYDVHFDKDRGDLSCLSCHGQDNLSEEQKQYHNPHNFLKGNDSAGEVDPVLDYNPSMQTCIKCHWGSEAAAAAAHTVFGPAAATHISKIECQVCHIPYKTYWTFRFFNDLIGYSNNFDNRFRSFTFDNGNVTMQQFPPEWAIPAFAATPTYGVNYAFTITQTTDGGNDVIVPMTMIDMDPYRALMRWNDNGTMFGMWATGANPLMKPYLFPYRWAPVIVKRYTIDDNGNQVLRAGLINPIVVATWMDASTNRVLFIRELNAAVKGATPPGGSTIDPEMAEKEVPAIVMRPASEAGLEEGMKDANGNDTGMVAAVQLINGKFIYDNDGDMVPEIDTPEEYEAMKEALTEVLDKEDPNHPHNPVIFVGMAPFGVDHGVLPASYALGAQQNGPLSCAACHNDDETLNRLSPAVYSGDMTKGRFVTLVPFALPDEAIKESKAAGAWKMPPGVTTVSVKTPDGKDKKLMGATQGAFMNFVSVPVESKEYAAYALVTPAQSDTVIMDGITISYPKNAVDTPTMIKVEKVEDASIEEAALEAAKSAGIQSPVIAGELYKIETKNNEFNLPVNFTLPYEAYKVSEKVVLLTSEDGKNWKILTSQAMNPDNPRISFSTTKLSYFAIVGPAATNTISPYLPSDCNVVPSDNGTIAKIEVTMPDFKKMNITVAVEGGFVINSPEYYEGFKDELEKLAQEERIAEVIVPGLKISPEANATFVNATFEGIPEDKIPSIAAYVEKGTELLPESAVEVEKYPSEGKVVVRVNLASRDITRATDELYLTLGVPASAVLPSTSTANTASGGGGGCSLAPATTASSGLASFGAMLSGLLGLMFGRRRKKKQ